MCLFFVSGSNSQAVMTQEPSLTVSPGGTVTLTCGSSAGAVTGSHYPYWFQQKPGQAPRTLIYNTNFKHSWTPAWFSGSLLGGKAALILSGSEDEADYYCAIWHSSASHSDTHTWGSGTKTSACSHSCSRTLIPFLASSSSKSGIDPGLPSFFSPSHHLASSSHRNKEEVAKKGKGSARQYPRQQSQAVTPDGVRRWWRCLEPGNSADPLTKVRRGGKNRGLDG
uniref:Ig-like domain-containing protein n=1 Tax=Theropithecus gelada TaxID=9565 RepID=A0A8D2DZM4_THEGE